MPIDRLGRPLADPVEWLEAEEALEGAGIPYLADQYELRLDDGSWLKVRLTKVTPEAIVVKKDDWGAKAVGAPQRFFTLPFPMPPNQPTA